MKAGDIVGFNREGCEVREPEYKEWHGKVIECDGDECKVLWDKAPNHACPGCDGKGVVKYLWTVKRTHLRRI